MAGGGNYKAGGKLGFNTNIDDFLMKFGTLVDGPNMENRFTKSKSLYKGPLLTGTSVTDVQDTSESENQYTFKECPPTKNFKTTDNGSIKK